MAFAFAEAQGRYNLADLTATAKKEGDGYVLNGQKSVVLGAPWADTLIVTARTGGSRRETQGVSVFLVEKAAKGVSARDYAAMSGLRASEMIFENAPARLIGNEGAALPLLEAVVDRAIAAHLAEANGAIAILMNATIEYAKTRKQFGQPIGKFQVLQHRMVDMFIAQQQAQSASLMANLKLDAVDGAARRVRGQGGGGQICPRGGRGGGADSWRHRHDRRTQCRPLFQAAGAAGNALRLARSSSSPDGRSRPVKRAPSPAPFLLSRSLVVARLPLCAKRMEGKVPT